MTADKILSPVLMDADRWIHTVTVNGLDDMYPVAAEHDEHTTADRRLALSGQRVKGGVWPEGHGVVEIEDIPIPLPEWWFNVYAEAQFGYPDRLLADRIASAHRIAIVHVGTRDGVDFAEVIRP